MILEEEFTKIVHIYSGKYLKGRFTYFPVGLISNCPKQFGERIKGGLNRTKRFAISYSK